MKRPSSATAATLAACLIGIGVGIYDFKRIGVLRKAHQELEVRAQALGLSSASGEMRKVGRIRRDEGAEAERIAREIIAAALALPAEAGDWSKLEPGWLALAAPLAELSPSQLKVFIREVDGAIGTEGMRILQKLASTAFILLAESDPASALAFFSSHVEGLKPVIWTMLPLSRAVSGLAEQDPFAALEWVRQNSSERLGSVFGDAKLSVVRHLAAHDPAIAFEAFQEFDLPSDPYTLLRIFQGTSDPSNRATMLVEFRKYILSQGEKAQADLSGKVLTQLSRGLSEKPFAASAGWLESLTPPEAEAFALGLSNDRVREPGAWIGWLAEAPVSQATLETVIQALMHGWIQTDALAAGNWLAQAPDNAARTPAVRAYVDAIAPLDPHLAAQWALTLPADDAAPTENGE